MRDSYSRGGRPRMRGQRSWMANLTEDEVREIRRMAADGVRGAYIAKKFGVRQTTVCSINTGRSWKHLPVSPVADMVTHRNTKLNDCQAGEIKMKLIDSYKVTSIGKEYSIHPNAVYQIKHGFTWKHAKL
jgi:uncharacterized protein YjcR